MRVPPISSPAVRFDMLESYGMSRVGIGSCREGAARLRLRNDVDLGKDSAIELHFYGVAVDYYSAVEVFAALSGNPDSPFIRGFFQTRPDFLRGFGGRILTDSAAAYLRGRASDDDDVPLLRTSEGEEFTHSEIGLIKN